VFVFTVVGVGAAIAVGTVGRRRAVCALPSEPARQLDLTRPADRDHIAADIKAVVASATTYANRIAQLPPSSSSPDAIAGHKTLGPRAYAYCRDTQLKELARIHGVAPVVVKGLAEAEGAGWFADTAGPVGPQRGMK
jgi:hypothetical protein